MPPVGLANAPVNSHSDEPILRTVDELLATDKSTWEYVPIPQENALGYEHAAMGLNKLVFRPGVTYHVPKKIADFIRERVSAYARSVVRIMQPNRDQAAINAVPVGTSGGTDTRTATAAELELMR